MGPSNQKRGECIFCGQGGLTKEHFYPSWMHPFIPNNTLRGEKVITSHPVKGETIERDSSGNAGLHTMKLRVVCAPCNNGWMNRLENEARPTLTKMILGQRHLISDDQQEKVAKWCVAKVIVAEHATGAVPMTPPADRQSFAHSREIPDYFRVYVCAHKLEPQLGYTRRTSTVSLARGRPVPELQGMRRNVQQVSFFMGKALVHVNAARVEGFAIEDRFQMPLVHKDMRFWPPSHSRIKWPGKSVLHFEQIRALANSWAIIAQSNSTLWSEIPGEGWN